DEVAAGAGLTDVGLEPERAFRELLHDGCLRRWLDGRIVEISMIRERAPSCEEKGERRESERTKSSGKERHAAHPTGWARKRNAPVWGLLHVFREAGVDDLHPRRRIALHRRARAVAQLDPVVGGVDVELAASACGGVRDLGEVG